MSARRGFVLPVALVVMVAVSIIAITTLQVTTNDVRANRSLRLASRALFAAEAGAERTLARWSAGPFASLAPGDSAGTGWVSLPDGSLYRSEVLRVDDGTAPSPVFRVLTEGRPGRGQSASRQIVTMVQAGVGSGGCCGASLEIQGRVRVRAPRRPRGTRGRWEPPPQIDGRDHQPTAWAGMCPAPAGAAAGVRSDRARNVILQRNARIEGSPEIATDDGIGDGLADALGSASWNDLVARADVSFSGRTTRLRGSIRPSVSRGECRTEDDRNWGSPTLPTSPCGDYLPVIHADGNLDIRASGEGQGILLVDGNLVIARDFDFYGVVLVKGRLVLRGGARITGGVRVVNGPGGSRQSVVLDDSEIRYSSCAAARATSGLGGARLLPGRHWFEIP